MDFSEYSELVKTTAARPMEITAELTDWALGISSEAGEIAEIVKHVVFHKHSFDKDHLVEELGDLLWYAAMMADCCGVPLEEVATRNIKKLAIRYPKGFSPEASQARNLQMENKGK